MGAFFDTKNVRYSAPPIVEVHPYHYVQVVAFVIVVFGVKYTIPKGAKSNFGSVPWLFWWIVRPDDPILRIAAIVHDWLVGEYSGKPVMGWNAANDILYEIVKAHCFDPDSWRDASGFKEKVFWYMKGQWHRLKRHLIFRAVKIHGEIGGMA